MAKKIQYSLYGCIVILLFVLFFIFVPEKYRTISIISLLPISITILGFYASLLIPFKQKEILHMIKIKRELKGKKLTDLKELVETLPLFLKKQEVFQIEKEVQKINDPFIKESFKTLVTQKDTEHVQSHILKNIRHFQQTYQPTQSVLQFSLSLFPVWGIIGSVVGFILVVQQSMTLTLLLTFMGVSLIPLLFSVIYSQFFLKKNYYALTHYIKEETAKKEMVSDIVVCVSGQQPLVLLKDKVGGFMTKELHEIIEQYEKQKENKLSVKKQLESILTDDLDDVLRLIKAKKVKKI